MSYRILSVPTQGRRHATLTRNQEGQELGNSSATWLGRILSAHVISYSFILKVVTGLGICRIQHRVQKVILLDRIASAILNDYCGVSHVRCDHNCLFNSLSSASSAIVLISCSYLALVPLIIAFTSEGRFARRPDSVRKSTIAVTKGWLLSYGFSSVNHGLRREYDPAYSVERVQPAPAVS